MHAIDEFVRLHTEGSKIVSTFTIHRLQFIGRDAGTKKRQGGQKISKRHIVIILELKPGRTCSEPLQGHSGVFRILA